MYFSNSSSVKERAAKTSSELEVTPPLLALASLKMIHPAFSSLILASYTSSDKHFDIHGNTYLSEEKIGSFNNVFEFGEALLVDEKMDIIDVNCLRPASTRDKQIGCRQVIQVKFISETKPILNDSAIYIKEGMFTFIRRQTNQLFTW